MSETDPAIIGVQACGCVTLAIARPDRTLPAKDRRWEDRAMAEIIHAGGEIRRTTVGEAREMENFLPARCPHKPKGWKVAA